MKLAFIVVVGLALAGCSILQQLEGGSGGAAAATTTTTATGVGGGVAQGVDCGVDPNTSATLCLGNTLCPGLVVDGEVFPACGFRIGGTILDVECSCGGSLCPLGTATTCAQVQALLSQSNEGIVCAQLSTGACAAGTPVTTTTATTAASSGGSCTQACQSECGGVPSCLQLCGC